MHLEQKNVKVYLYHGRGIAIRDGGAMQEVQVTNPEVFPKLQERDTKAYARYMRQLQKVHADYGRAPAVQNLQVVETRAVR
jgi:hypothetical protein